MLNLYGVSEKASASQNIGFNRYGSGISVSGKHDGGVNNNLDGSRDLINAYGIDRRQTKRQLKLDHHYSNTKRAKTWREAEDEEFNWKDFINTKPSPSPSPSPSPFPLYYTSATGQVSPAPLPSPSPSPFPFYYTSATGQVSPAPSPSQSPFPFYYTSPTGQVSPAPSPSQSHLPFYYTSAIGQVSPAPSQLPSPFPFYYTSPTVQVSSPPPPISPWKHQHEILPNQQFQALMQQPPPLPPHHHHHHHHHHHPHQHHHEIVPPNNNNNNPCSTGSPSISGLLSSLLSKGVISLEKQVSPPIEDSMPLDFNPEFLKVRHESVINALHSDFPRQCRTCGRRFKFQEELNNHLDWHYRSRLNLKKLKEMRSRDWFLTDTLWLESAKATNEINLQFSDSIENNTDKHDTIAVTADYSQRACALCGENFEDFYSEETDDWMYKGATYMNMSSEFRSIVHAKCMND